MKEELVQMAMELIPDYQFIPDDDSYLVNCASHFHLRLECYIHNNDRNYRAETHGLQIREYYPGSKVDEFLNSKPEQEFQKKLTQCIQE